jgi:hypothetical protein
MNNFIQIEKYELQQWIEELTQYNSLMLTISEPHAKIKRVLANGNNLEPVIDQIIKFVNRYVFGKHKRFEFIKGLIVEENPDTQPHYHILLKRPESMDFNVFKYKMEQASNRLCLDNFRLDLSDSNLSSRLKDALSMPCYDAFSKVTEVHKNIGSYLTKERANYYVLQGRKFSRRTDCLDLRVNYKNCRTSYEMAIGAR